MAETNLLLTIQRKTAFQHGSMGDSIMVKKLNTAKHLTKKRTKQNQSRKKRNRNPRNLKIQLQVLQGDWGEIKPNEIAILLQDTAFHINRLLRHPFQENIQVEPSQVDHPKALYRAPSEEPYTIWLSARDHFWCKFAYQFAHEFCHVLSGYESIRENPNNWFHESICELASMFTIRCMAVRWLTHPAFPGRTDYAAALSEYGRDLLNKQGSQLSTDMSLNNWLSLNEVVLREAPVHDPDQRSNQTLVAYQLLPIFEKTPGGWNAIRKLPNSTSLLADYFVAWYAKVDPEDRVFVARLSDVFGYTIPLEVN